MGICFVVRHLQKQTTTMKDNVVTYFMWYVFNRFNLEESELLFGNLAEHVFYKLIGMGGRSNALSWYAELDDECRQKLVDRAIEIYCNE